MFSYIKIILNIIPFFFITSLIIWSYWVYVLNWTLNLLTKGDFNGNNNIKIIIIF